MEPWLREDLERLRERQNSDRIPLTLELPLPHDEETPEEPAPSVERGVVIIPL